MSSTKETFLAFKLEYGVRLITLISVVLSKKCKNLNIQVMLYFDQVNFDTTE